jgi:hypothetical protein
MPTVPVTVDDFDQAESHRYFKRYAALGAFGSFFHIRKPTPIDKQDVIRMNRDTLYSLAILDLTSPVTVVKPDPGTRYQSLMAVNEDHSIFPAEHDGGEFTFTQESLGTRYAALIVRTFADPAHADDVTAANALQDRLEIKQADAGSLQLPDWDQESLDKVRAAYLALAATKADIGGLFGIKGQMDRLDHMLGTAMGWGGNRREGAIYASVQPERNDGATAYVLKAKDVPVDGFWSVTVYGEDGYMKPNEYDAYSFNDVTAAKDPDGGVTIHFGGEPGTSNYLPITSGWSYVVRMYRPRKELLDGTWTFPAAEAV